MEEGTRNMTNLRSALSLAATAAVLGAVSIPALAVTSSFGFGPTGATPTTFAGATLGTATSITVPASEATTGAVAGAFAGLPAGTPVTLTPTTLATGTTTDFSVTFAGDTFTFTGEGVTSTLGPGSDGPISSSNQWSELGFLTDTAGDITVPGGALGTLSFSFTQSTFPALGPVTPGASFVTNVPITPPGTPEPGNVAMLVGLGLSSAGFLIRRRRSK
jgi:hypothetical protein